VSAFIAASRYEGLFTVFTAAILILIRRRYKEAAVLVAASALPVVIYGAISTHYGWYFLPNSVLLKGVRPELTAVYFNSLLRRMINYPAVSLLAATILIYSVMTIKRWKWNQGPVLAFIFLGTFCFQSIFGRFGWFYRYEAYLIALGLVAFWVMVFGDFASDIPRWKRGVAVVMLLLLLVLPIRQRAFDAMHKAPKGSQNAYEQQYQMGLFLSRYYQGQSVAVNDVGLVNYLADIRCLDVQGLASMEVARAMVDDHILDPTELASAVDAVHPRIALIFSSFYSQLLPPGWLDVGEWTVQNYVMAGSDTVSFYATSPEEKQTLSTNLKRYAPYLPPDVIQNGEYTE
jgi:hypothetical protein